MIRGLLILLFSCWLSLSFAQLSSVPNPKHLIQIGLRSDPILFNEFGYMFIGKKYLNFQVKCSFQREKPYDDGRLIKSNYYGVGNHVDFRNSYFLFKPGIALLRVTKPNRTFITFFNCILSKSKDILNIDVNDPLLGRVNLETIEKNTYQFVELEFQLHQDLSKNIAFNFGASLGLPMQDSKLIFTDVYNGAFSNRDLYTPGVGNREGVYVNLNVGLLIKPY